jgi:hypothetical protein
VESLSPALEKSSSPSDEICRVTFVFENNRLYFNSLREEIKKSLGIESHLLLRLVNILPAPILQGQQDLPSLNSNSRSTQTSFHEPQMISFRQPNTRIFRQITQENRRWRVFALRGIGPPISTFCSADTDFEAVSTPNAAAISTARRVERVYVVFLK